MKLVEILAKELKEWPLGGEYAEQDKDREVRFSGRATSHDFFAYVLADEDKDISCSDGIPYAGRVTRAQWRAERDRQKGGEWKRHRGGKCPVSENSVIDVKLDTGDTMKNEVAGNWEWSHQDIYPRITQYRVISQPQAEEVEVKDTTIGTLSYKVEIDTTEATQAIDELAAKWDQMETPFKWRDEVAELNAYIEKYTRERDALIELLASEGFALIPPVVSVMSEFSALTIPLEDCQVGDIVEVVSLEGFAGSSVQIGDQMPITSVDSRDGTVQVACGTCGDEDNYKFIRRP